GVVASVALGIERIHAIVLGCDKDDVVLTLARYREIRHQQRFRINIAVHRLRKQLAEPGRTYSSGGEDRLVGIGSRPRHVIVICDDIDLRARSWRTGYRTTDG